MRFITTLLAFSGMYLLSFGQSIHQEQSNYYGQFNFASEAEYNSLADPLPTQQSSSAKKKTCPLNKVVYGWNPYWVGTSYNNYDFSLLSTFSYFSYELVPSTGSYSSIHSWKTSPSIDLAKAAGCKVELCVTNFGSTNNTTFLTSATAQQTFIDTIISLINFRGADGVNIDFEGIPGSQRNNLTSFMTNLSTQLKAAISGATVTMAIFSVDWSNVFDIPALNPVVDQFIIMGYGYYYSGSSIAGPMAEFYKGTIWSNYNLVRSVNYYLNEGVTPSKLILGLPYYGYEWQTVDNSVPSSTVSPIGSRTYAYVRNNYVSAYGKNWDPEGFNVYYAYQSSGNWRQAWVDDEYTLGKRYDMVNQKDIGGIGIWALGYDNGYNELWDLLYEKFTPCGTIPCSDTIYDMGGPFGDHYDDEDYTFTIAPTGATTVSLDFSSFSLEAGFDSLWIYDGPSTSSPLIGGYSGTSSPGMVTSTDTAMTLRFYSDGATLESGWEAVWNCFVDTTTPTPPIASFVSDIVQGCEPLTINFSDSSANDPDAWLWTFTGADITSDTISNPTITYSTPGSYDVTLVVSNIWGSSGITYSNYITVYPIPSVSVSADVALCEGDSVTLQASGGNSYLWNTGQTDSIIIVTPLITTTYSVSTSANGCTSSPDSLTVTVVTPPNGSVTPNQTVCEGDSVTLTGSGGDDYLWNTGDTTDAIVIIADTGTTSYFAAISKPTCAQVDTQYTVITGIAKPLTAFTISDSLVYLPSASVTFSNNSNNTSTYWWDFGDGNTSLDKSPWHTYTDTGKYTITLVAGNDVCKNDTLIVPEMIEVTYGTNVQGVIPTEFHFSIFPNPFESSFIIKYHLEKTQKLKIELLDLMGKQLYVANKDHKKKGPHQFEINLDNQQIPGGIYLLKLSTATQSYYGKLLKY